MNRKTKKERNVKLSGFIRINSRGITIKVWWAAVDMTERNIFLPQCIRKFAEECSEQCYDRISRLCQFIEKPVTKFEIQSYLHLAVEFLQSLEPLSRSQECTAFQPIRKNDAFRSLHIRHDEPISDPMIKVLRSSVQACDALWVLGSTSLHSAVCRVRSSCRVPWGWWCTRGSLVQGAGPRHASG
jgi:hypothetical protein